MIIRYFSVFLLSVFCSQNSWAEASPLDDSSLSQSAGGDLKESKAHKDHILDKDHVTEEINEVRQTLRKPHGGSNANWTRSNRRRINTLLDNSSSTKDLASERPLPEINPAVLPKGELPKPGGSDLEAGGASTLRPPVQTPPPGK